MGNENKYIYIIVTAIITAIITWAISNDSRVLEKSYLKDLQYEIDYQREEIEELKSNKYIELDNKVSNIEYIIQNMELDIKGIYEKIIPEEERQPITGTVN